MGSVAGRNKIKSRNNRQVFPDQAFPDSTAAATKVVQLQESQEAYVQGDPATSVMYIQEGNVKLSVVNEVPDKYHDTYQENLQALIYAKARGQKLTIVPHVSRAPAIDLMEALKKSLTNKNTQTREQSPLRAVPKRVESGRKTRKTS